jgi:hypothetical protein
MSDTKQIVDTEIVNEEVSKEKPQETVREKVEVFRPTPTPFPDSKPYEAK